MSWIKDYLSFSKRERNAFIGLVVIIGAFIFLPDLFTVKKGAVAISAQVQKEAAQKKQQLPGDNQPTPFTQPAKDRETRLFQFDPNTLEEAGFITLGLPERTARTIINYRNKGGQFRKPEDLRKIYSLQKADADRIIPYARINSNNGYGQKDYPVYAPKKDYPTQAHVVAIDINTATVDQWKSLPGIGDILSARIVKFRQSIGGFNSIDQVAKTYGLRDSTFRLIKPYLLLSAPTVNKININTARENELMECNAISKEVAQAIVIYRKQKGPFPSVEDLRKIVFINEEMFRKMAPCLTAE